MQFNSRLSRIIQLTKFLIMIIGQSNVVDNFKLKNQRLIKFVWHPLPMFSVRLVGLQFLAVIINLLRYIGIVMEFNDSSS